MSGTKALVQNQYIERTGIIATPAELHQLLKLANPPITPGDTPPLALLDAIDVYAVRHGLPVLHKGHYGVDLFTGEFLKSV